MEINFYFIKYTDGGILEAACSRGEKSTQNFTIGHGELEKGGRVWLIHMRVVEFSFPPFSSLVLTLE